MMNLMAIPALNVNVGKRMIFNFVSGNSVQTYAKMAMIAPLAPMDKPAWPNPTLYM